MPEMKVNPKPATQPYMPSAVAAPSPDIKPEARPSARVRRMHNTPIGPTGAAMEKPIRRPRKKRERSIRFDCARLTARSAPRADGSSPGSFEHIPEQAADDMPAIIGAGTAGTGTELSLSEQGCERTFKCCIRDGLSTQGFFSLRGAERSAAAGTHSDVNIFDPAALAFEPDGTIQDW